VWIGMPHHCSSCGLELIRGAKFCVGCGAAASIGIVSTDAEGTARADQEDADRRQAAILFANICGYTALAGAAIPNRYATCWVDSSK
jgi:hypothetical protein